jgi:hypothetical protein
MQRARNLFDQNKIAIIWDFDKTLIPYDMQRPLFHHYGVDEETFWQECNALPEYYRSRGYELVSRDQMYLLHILSYVKAGRFTGLNNSLLRELGSHLAYFDGLPDLFQALQDHVRTSDPTFAIHDIAVEHYVVSSGLRQIILGSAIAPYLDGVWACEYLEDAPGPGYLDPAYREPGDGHREISQIIYAVDNTTKTRAIFEINKGTNFHPEIDVNASIPHDDRRIPFANMIYVADGPSDVPVFSVVNQNGGKTLGVYAPASVPDFRKANELQRQHRVQAIAPADYREGSQAYLWLMTAVEEIAERIVESKRVSLGQRVGRPPSHRPAARPPRTPPSLPLPLEVPRSMGVPGSLPLSQEVASPVIPKPQDRLDPADTLLVPPAVSGIPSPAPATSSAPVTPNGYDDASLTAEAAPDPGA